MRAGGPLAAPCAPAARMAATAAALAAALAGSLMVGSVPVPPRAVVEALKPPWGGPASAGGPQAVIVRELRLPRGVVAAATGFSLGMAGAALQGLFRNPLADPYVVGASGGAALGATAAVVWGWRGPAGGLSPVPLAAFAGALAAVLVVYALAGAGEPGSMQALLLVGAAVSTLLSALVSGLLLLQDRQHLAVFGWLVGGFSGSGWAALAGMLPVMAAGGSVVLACHRALDALALGEETARSLGVALGRLRAAVVGGASLLTAAAVAAGGIIGFVGLVAPHVARLLFPASHRWSLPASGLFGALVTLAADGAGRVLLAPVELPAGLLTALLGAPFFLYLLHTRGRPGRAAGS